jgi:HEAT repeat protein
MRPVVEHLLRHPDVEARRRVILMLGRSRGPDMAESGPVPDMAVELLLSAMHDRDASVRAESIVALSRFRDPRIEPALRIALTDAEEMVRLRAVDAMERLGTPEPLPLALRDPSPLVRVQAIKALRWTGAEPVLAELLASLHDPAEAVRLEVVELLASHPTGEVITALVAALPGESFPLIRQKMLALVGKHTEESAASRARDVFQKHLDDPAPEVRAQVVQYLGDLGDPDLLPELLSRVGDEASEVRLALVRALERLDGMVPVGIGESFLRDSAPEVRDAAVWSFRVRPAPEGLPLTLPLLDDPADLVRLSVAVLLAAFHVRGEFSLEQLRAVYTATTLAGRHALLDICDGIRDRRLVPLLVGAILEGEPTERSRAFQVLTELKRGDPARRHPRVIEELHRRDLVNGVLTRPPVIDGPAAARRLVEPLPATGPALLNPAVVFRVSAPGRLAPGTTALVQLWAALPDQLTWLETLANRALDESDYRIQSKLAVPGARLGFSARLHIEGLEPIDVEDDLFWDGNPAAARFLVRVPPNAPAQELAARISIHREGIPITQLSTTLEIGPAAAPMLRECREQRKQQIEITREPRDENSLQVRIQVLRQVVPWLAEASVAFRPLVPGHFPDTDALWAVLRSRVRV